MELPEKPRMVVRVDFYPAKGEMRSFGEFTINGFRSADKFFEENKGDYLASWANGQKTVLRDFPNWLPIWHLVRAFLVRALPIDFSGGTPPEGWHPSGRAYELNCDKHGVGHYTGNNGVHGCCGCCGQVHKPGILEPLGNFEFKEDADEEID